MNEVLIVVPVYRERLSISERISLRQLYRILGSHPICFMAPKKMDQIFLKRNLYAELFPDEEFAGRLQYSKLLLNPKFYERFLSYKYILIYQLDAFAFSDKLRYFCQQGYDYWGAPMPVTYWKNTFARVGNGGFSLRKVSSCIHVTKMRQEIYEKTGLQIEFEKSEDEFFGYCGKSHDINFSVPNAKKAACFSIEFNVAHAWDKLSLSNLPFGCHAWNRPQYFKLWQPILSHYVKKQSLEKVEEEFGGTVYKSYRSMEWERVFILLFDRMLRSPKRAVTSILDNILPKSRQYILWGNGVVGKRANKLLTEYNRSVICIFDRNANIMPGIKNGDIPVAKPDRDFISNNSVVLITTNKYSNEIKQQLLDWGLSEDNNFRDYKQIEDGLLKQYYTSIWEKMNKR